MTPRRRRTTKILLITALAVLAVALIVAPAALAAAGGGSAGYSGGGEGGGGGGVHGFELYLLIRVLIDIALLGHGKGAIVLVVLALLYWFLRSGLPKMQAAWRARKQSGRAARRDTRKRERRVELAAAEAADVDPIFDPEHVRTAAGALFLAIQFAWDAEDRGSLRTLVAPSLLQEWERRLDDFDRKGWRNRVQPVGEPTVEYVGLNRSGPADEHRVVVRIEAKLRDYVVDSAGRHIKRAGQFTESVRVREFWTLARRDDRWILQSIEQGAEGAHLLQDQIAATPWSNTQALRDEALVEGAAAEAVPAGTRVSEVADLQLEGDARAAAMDLSLADGRFAPDVLEVAARRAVAAWTEAVDGSDAQLRRIANTLAVRELLHPGDPSGRTRLVVRGAQVKQITVAALDAGVEPPTMTIDVHLRGRRYIEDRDTTKVLEGDPARETSFVERWTLALSGDASQPWRIVAVGSPSGSASGPAPAARHS
ncbi:MAG: Tim44 domain-containing protein [Solirubrobacteraceae bacterium]